MLNLIQYQQHIFFKKKLGAVTSELKKRALFSVHSSKVTSVIMCVAANSMGNLLICERSIKR